MYGKITTLAVAAMAGTVLAQPGTFTDLGSHTSTQTFTQPVTLTAANDIQWFRVVLPPVTSTLGWVDIWTSAPGDMTDTEIGLYDASGAGAGSATTYNDDDSGPGLFSQLTFGSTVARTNLGNGALARNGADGSLAGGVYYLAVGRYAVTFAPAFVVTSTYTGAQRTITLNFDINSPTDPYPPSGTGAATASTVGLGGTSVLTVTVAPGGNPTSTGITVTGDLSQIGGSSTQQFFDDGTNGDAVAGNGVYTYTATVNAPAGAYQLPFNVVDAQSRTGTGNIALTVSDPTPIGVVGAFVPSAASSSMGLLTATVTPGNYPASTGVTVQANMTSVGGSATAALFDDGTHGDQVAGNGVYSLEFPLPASGSYTVNVTASDAQSRSTPRDVAVLYKDAGAIVGSDTDPATVDVITTSMANSLGAVAWMKFTIPVDIVNDGDNAVIGSFLDIDTEGTGEEASVAGTLSDTELGLYQSDGTFLDTDDDDGSYFHSMLSYGDVAPNRTAFGTAPNQGVVGNGRDGGLTAGTYWLAIANFNAVFVTNFGATTTNTTAAAGDYIVNFRTNIPGQGRGPCSIADVGMAGGEPGQDDLLDNNDFIAFINYFFAQNSIADMGQAGGEPGSDNAWDNNDFIAFINYFFQDQANCNG